MIKLLVGLFVIPLIVVYNAFSWGFVVERYWHWFLLDVFPELSSINFWQAVSLSFFLSLFKKHEIHNYVENTNKRWTPLIGMIITPWFSLIIAYFFR